MKNSTVRKRNHSCFIIYCLLQINFDQDMVIFNANNYSLVEVNQANISLVVLDNTSPKLNSIPNGGGVFYAPLPNFSKCAKKCFISGSPYCLTLNVWP